jgi:D-3-phosphoglycerate dehydrogenase
MAAPLVLALDLEWEDLGPEEAALAVLGAQLVRPNELQDVQLEDVVALITEGVSLRRDDLTRYPKLKVVSLLATGYDTVDLEAAGELGIVVTNVGGYCTDEVADHTLALALSLVRRLDSLRNQALEGRWIGVDLGSVRRSAESIWGVIGFGRIGQAVARRAAAFGFSVWAYDAQLSAERVAQAGARPAQLEELLAEADIVSVHAARIPGRDDRMLDRRRLGLLRPSAYLVNVARGAFIDEDALADALDAGRLAGAALDVLTEEPPDPSNRLVAHPRTIITPHAAWYSDSAEAELRARGIGAVVDALSGKTPADLVPELR